MALDQDDSTSPAARDSMWPMLIASAILLSSNYQRFNVDFLCRLPIPGQHYRALQMSETYVGKFKVICSCSYCAVCGVSTSLFLKDRTLSTLPEYLHHTSNA